MQTHEAFIHGVARLAASRLSSVDRAKVEAIKLTYGAGPAGTRGVTYYGAWSKGKGQEGIPFVEVCAFGQEHVWQVAGTTLHELGHVLAGHDAGHAGAWKEACAKVGLRRALAAGQAYVPALFAPDMREGIALLPRPDEGEPVGRLTGAAGARLRPCPLGIGTRGGKSRGPGAGTRHRLYECACEPPVKVRAGTRVLRAHCDVCGEPFAPRF